MHIYWDWREVGEDIFVTFQKTYLSNEEPIRFYEYVFGVHRHPNTQYWVILGMLKNIDLRVLAKIYVLTSNLKYNLVQIPPIQPCIGIVPAMKNLN